MKNNLARCIGLWLAEGDTKTSREITFTNNCFELIQLFYNVVGNYGKECNVNLQVYKPSKSSNFRTIDEQNVSVKEYTDDRASKPYYIVRFYSTELCKNWNDNVEKAKQNEEMYPYILQGFFAGEGNLYEGKRNSRRIRIAQGEPDEFLEEMLDHLGINYRFRSENRSYVVTKKCNWDEFAELNLCNLHPIKKEKFWEIYNGFQEAHYNKGELKKEVFKVLDKPWRTKELAEKFDRSQARLCDVLMLLKKEGRAVNYKAGSYSYWIREDQEAVIISEVKSDYLNLLKDNPLKVGEIADYFSVRKKSAYKNLYRLQELGLIKKKDHEWETVDEDKEVIVL
jgi:hypothetical protein